MWCASVRPRETSKRASQPAGTSCPATGNHGIPALSVQTEVTRAAYAHGKLNNQHVHMLLDSGASCSVVDKHLVTVDGLESVGPMKLTNADGRGLTAIGRTTMRVTLPGITTSQTFVVAEHLSAPAILGCDFLTRHGLVLDLGTGTFHGRDHPLKEGQQSLRKGDTCMLVLDDQCPQAMPFKGNTDGERKFDMPDDFHPTLVPVLKEHEQLFRTQLGKTDITEHVIDTREAAPVKVPPRPVPFHYKDRVHTQLQEMARHGIIRPSSSPWRFPAVYVPKDNGEICICVDYRMAGNFGGKIFWRIPENMSFGGIYFGG